MEKKLFNANDIVLDGRMDEPVWDEVQEYTGFRTLGCYGGKLAGNQTYFKILPCENRVFFGVKCMDANMDYVTSYVAKNEYHNNSVALFLSPIGETSQCYHLLFSYDGQNVYDFYLDGVCMKQVFFPNINYAIYTGETYWSIEIELPLSLFSLTDTGSWSDKWLIDVVRNNPVHTKDISGAREMPNIYGSAECFVASCWCLLDKHFNEYEKFRLVDGFPMRSVCDEMRLLNVEIDIRGKEQDNYVGDMVIKTSNVVAGMFEVISDHSEPVTATMEAGLNTIKVPCYFKELINYKVSIDLKRVNDGEVFRYMYPVKIVYDPMQLTLTLPEYRGNFYPGQDYTKIVGNVTAKKPVTLKLEGAGVGTKIITPNEDGSFVFETPNFEVGEAFLTASIDGWEIKKKIRRLAPTGHMMSWISGGNLIVDGKPVLRRHIYAEYYRGGEAFKRKYNADNLHQTKYLSLAEAKTQPLFLVEGSEQPGGETRQDIMPSEEMCRKFDAELEAVKDKDYALYRFDDEPENREISYIYLKNWYNYISDKDPYHVLALATNFPEKHVETCDLMCTEIYISPVNTESGRTYKTPLSFIGRKLAPATNLTRTDKCVGCMPSCYVYLPYAEGRDYQNLDEMICHTWEGLAHGAKDLWPYAYHDLNDRPALYEGIRYVFSSVEALEDLLLLGKRTVLKRTEDMDAVMWDTGNEKMFVLINLTPNPMQVTLDDLGGAWYDFRHNKTIKGNTFNLKPVEVVIGTSNVRDENLPSYADTAALVDKLEYQRTHGGSLLFNRFADLTFTASYFGHGYKLFDGVKDNLGWSPPEGKAQFAEVDLTKVKPAFNKVVISGWHIDDMELKVRNNGELSVPEIAEIHTEEFSTTFILKGLICPEALRLEFHQDKIELYEIEVFATK